MVKLFDLYATVQKCEVGKIFVMFLSVFYQVNITIFTVILWNITMYFKLY